MASLELSFQGVQKRLRPYIELARVDKPIGIWLLFLPACWGLMMAYKGLPPLYELFLIFMGTVLMRGAGCTLNDIVDQRYDRHVMRTQSRPLARGVLASRQAFVFLGLQLTLAGLILIQFNQTTILLGFVALVLVLLYPWMKRITYWPQVFLGLTMNWGLVLAYVATGTPVRSSLWVVYGAAVLWALAYDTIYAYQDLKDDALVGVKSSPLVLQDRAKPFLALCYGIVVLLLMVAGTMEHVRWSYYFVLILIGCHFWWQVQSFQGEDPVICRRLFCSNQWIGGLVLLALLWGYWY